MNVGSQLPVLATRGTKYEDINDIMVYTNT